MLTKRCDLRNKTVGIIITIISPAVTTCQPDTDKITFPSKYDGK